MSDSSLEQSIARRLRDQCVLDDGVLSALCDEDAAYRADVAKFRRTLSMRRLVKRIPLVGPMIRGAYRRVARGRRFTR
jgi:hypothetical protein